MNTPKNQGKRSIFVKRATSMANKIIPLLPQASAKQKPTDAGSQNLDTYTFTVGEVQGDETAYRNLPKQGSYQYSGIAFNGDDRSGRLKYTVDFDKNKVTAISAAWLPTNNVDLLAAGIAGQYRQSRHQR